MRKSFSLNEKETATYSFTLRNEAGQPVAAASLTGATLTLYEPESGTIVNSRSSQNVLNLNNVTIDNSGQVAWSIQLADVTLLDATRGTEVHRALFLFSWSDGVNAKGKPHEVDLVLTNLGKLS